MAGSLAEDRGHGRSPLQRSTRAALARRARYGLPPAPESAWAEARAAYSVPGGGWRRK